MLSLSWIESVLPVRTTDGEIRINPCFSQDINLYSHPRLAFEIFFASIPQQNDAVDSCLASDL